MGQFKDISIKDVINEINRSYFIPDIQREYVWMNNYKDKKIEKLFDSILRGYPIGSFLFGNYINQTLRPTKVGGRMITS